MDQKIVERDDYLRLSPGYAPNEKCKGRNAE
jgi:hypothetical protein